MFDANANDANKVAAALDRLRPHHFFEFDNQERVVHVSVCGATNSDEIAVHVGHLRDLRVVKFDTTDLTDEGVRHFSELLDLRRLWIEGAKITANGLACLDKLARLEELYIGNARHIDRSALECIARLVNLEKLHISGGTFCDADLAPLGALVNLEELSFSANEAVDGTFTAHLLNVSGLRYLKPGLHVTDTGLAQIAKLSSLRVLFVRGPCTNDGLKQLRSLRELQTLYITSEQVTSKGLTILTDLPGLVDVGIKATLVTDEAVEFLARCQHVSEILLLKTGMTPGGVARLREALPECDITDFERDYPADGFNPK
jgi:hypothetical protein